MSTHKGHYYLHPVRRRLWRTPGIGKRVVLGRMWTLARWKIGVAGWTQKPGVVKQWS